MPLSAVVTMLSKYQTDIRQAQTEVIQYLKNQTDAGDYRVNEIVAEVIPESKTVVSGGQYRARIILPQEIPTRNLRYLSMVLK